MGELPVLYADLPDDGEIDYLHGVALARGSVFVRLQAPPADRSIHVLSLWGPRRKEQLVLLAQPLGAPTPEGQRLRLSMPEGPIAVPRRVSPNAPTLGEEPEAAEARGTPAVSASHSPGPGRQLAGGKLIIEERVGEGGAGTVFRARHRDLGIHVAVKVMHEPYQRDAVFCQRFQQEALSASRLDHPNLTRVLDYGQEPDGLLYIAMEYLDGRSLRDVLEVEGRLRLGRALHIMTQVCSGLTHAHARKIVHRDIKPENLILVKGLDDDGRETELVKVCDFGIAHGAGASGGAVFAGTPAYMSPEQCRGEEPDVQTDVYACGVVLYELLTGKLPITGEDTQELLKNQQTALPEPPSRHFRGLGPRIDRLVLRALAKEREVRPLDARDLRSELRTIAEDVAISDSPYVSEVDARPSRPATRESMQRESSSFGAPASVFEPEQRSVPPPRRSAPDVASPPARRSAPSFGPSDRPPSGPDEDWIERGPVHGSSFMPGSIKPTASSVPPTERSDVARIIAPFLRKLAETTDAGRFASIVEPLDAKIKHLVEQGHLGSVWRLCSTLEVIADERPQPGTPPRGPHARRLLELFSEPTLLEQIAERAIDGLADRAEAARRLVVRAGTKGARALYSARLKHASFEARELFVAILREVGEAARPVLHEALGQLEGRLETKGVPDLVEDLIKALPHRDDETAGQLVGRYARSRAPRLAALATEALADVWGQRARALLLSQVSHAEDDVAIAALAGLRRLKAVDDACLRRIEPLLAWGEGVRMPVRFAAVEALADATSDARALARTLLERALASAKGSSGNVDDFVVVVSRTMLTVGGDAGLVAERWRSARGPLRPRLELLLREAAARRP